MAVVKEMLLLSWHKKERKRKESTAAFDALPAQTPAETPFSPSSVRIGEHGFAQHDSPGSRYGPSKGDEVYAQTVGTEGAGTGPSRNTAVLVQHMMERTSLKAEIEMAGARLDSMTAAREEPLEDVLTEVVTIQDKDTAKESKAEEELQASLVKLSDNPSTSL